MRWDEDRVNGGDSFEYVMKGRVVRGEQTNRNRMDVGASEGFCLSSWISERR